MDTSPASTAPHPDHLSSAAARGPRRVVMDGAQQVVLGLDVGTTGAKTAAFGLDGIAGPKVVREYPLDHPEPGHAVQDPGVVAEAALDSVAAVVAALGDATVVGLGVTTAMHGLLGLDAHHRPRTPLVTWADGRASDEAARLRGTVVGRALHRATGTPLHPMSPLAKLAWFSGRDQRVAATVRWWVGLKDWILLQLTGRLVTELSSASATGLYDVHERRWSPTALELAGIEVERLPEVLPTTAVLPLADDAAGRTGLPAGLPVVVGAGDGPVGNLATGATRPGVLGVSIGTSGAARAMVAALPPDLPPSLFAYALVDDAWVVGGAVSNGGVVTRWIARALAPDLAPGGGTDEQGDPDDPGAHDRALLELGATVPAGSDGLVMLPHLLPERAPLWDPTLQGAWLGLRHHHTRAHLVRAAVEGVVLQLGLVAEQVSRVQPFTEVRATGGVLRAALWREVLAAVLDRPVVVGQRTGGTALGTAALALAALDGNPTRSDLDDAVTRLQASQSDLVTEQPRTGEVAAYRRLRARIPALVEALHGYADLFS